MFELYGQNLYEALKDRDFKPFFAQDCVAMMHQCLLGVACKPLKGGAPAMPVPGGC